MQSHEASDAPTHPVILIEGERDLKPPPLMINAPGIGRRGPKKAPLSITEYAGYIAKDTARFDALGPDGAGLYAVVEAMPDWIVLIGAMVNSPAGIDFSAYPPTSSKAWTLLCAHVEPAR